MANVSLDKIYNRLSGASTYHPISAKTFGDWSTEAGDTVTVSQNGTKYKSPVSTYTMKWNGASETGGDLEAEQLLLQFVRRREQRRPEHTADREPHPGE